MTHLTMRIIDRRDNDSPIEGTCNKDNLKTISFLEMLGIELAARIDSGKKLPLCQEMFLLLAESRNDSATTACAEAIYELFVPTEKLAPIDTGLDWSEHHQKRRSEQEKFFDWLESVYWDLPLYTPDMSRDVSRPDYKNPLKEFKKWTMEKVSRLWIDKTLKRQDNLALKAFNFLCDNFDEGRFFAKAKKVHAVFTKQWSRGSGTWIPSIQDDDATYLWNQMKSSLLMADLPLITLWVKKAKEKDAPEMIYRILAHAYINFGGEILQPSN